MGKIQQYCIGQKLKNYRVLRGLKQHELAKKTGISIGMISNYETNSNVPHSDKLAILARELKFSMDEIYDLKLASTKTVSDEVTATCASVISGWSDDDRIYWLRIIRSFDNGLKTREDIRLELELRYKHEFGLGKLGSSF
ncbi:helix-turn-helix domain-containing protein [Marinoscillum sp.]|uniref:helix-turn-helix domain-containing protein n=1 Tax=Marinoscillum sp. TaxID=2024838 RepID=UPI003BA86030